MNLQYLLFTFEMKLYSFFCATNFVIYCSFDYITSSVVYSGENACGAGEGLRREGEGTGSLHFSTMKRLINCVNLQTADVFLFTAICKRCRLLLCNDEFTDACCSPLRMQGKGIQQDDCPTSIIVSKAEPVCITIYFVKKMLNINFI